MSLALVAARREELAGVLRLGGWRPWSRRSESAWRRRRAPESTLAYQRRDHSVSAIITGAGRERTERAMEWLLDTDRPDTILSLGFAGACSPNLDVGDLVLATHLSYLEGSPFDWDPESLEPMEQLEDPAPSHGGLEADGDMLERVRAAVEMNGIDFMPSPTLTVDSLVRTSGLSAWLGETFGVSCVDRESYWVAHAARNAGVPCLGVRAIAYGVSETLPEIASRLPDTPTGGRVGPVMRHGVLHPREMWRFSRSLRASRAALTNLTGVLTTDRALSPVA